MTQLVSPVSLPNSHFKWWVNARQHDAFPVLKIQPDLPLAWQKVIEQEFDYFRQRCTYFKIDLSQIRTLSVREGSFRVKKTFGGYAITIPQGARFPVASKNVMARYGERRNRYYIIKALALLFIMRVKRQYPESYRQLKSDFYPLHREKKAAVVNYLASTNLWYKRAKINYFRLTGHLSSWFVLHLDPVHLGFADHNSLENWRIDCAGLMAQTWELGFPDTLKAYGNRLRSIYRSVEENNHHIASHPIKARLSGARQRGLKENRKLRAKQDAILICIEQLRCIKDLKPSRK